ncbi:MAG: 50S ribosomal protein L6, partial [Desulfurococcaceae archaeon]
MKTLHIVEKVKIPENVSVQVEDSRVKVRGPKGELVKDFSHARRVYISVQEGYVVVEAYNVDRSLKALVGTIVAHIENMITG